MAYFFKSDTWYQQETTCLSITGTYEYSSDVQYCRVHCSLYFVVIMITFDSFRLVTFRFDFLR
jgi:hypothetical protein